ncbi:DUF3301 domain-containing protein [Methylobacter tundripaludum]|uniref:DUF3301 domain-containing protein n=1 Tax=Methylobacter tundripaludum (strain ATCC BAA-1195 / DSM 17260 / SV96) TaxID=697282 RepID=G3IRN1_METTV|nr:DUF3301 domain-containing protein [Methylobacter tundripaludum]EGW23650.1 hypothetical protein Mettu_2512 [Methylobacter tundripaludum SV96]
MLDDLILIALLLGAYLYWFNGQQVKEVALKAVRANCLNLEVQMLDEYVALNSIRLKRDPAGKMRVRRIFLFEFSSTGNERYNGICIMLGRRVESIQMEPYRFDG